MSNVTSVIVRGVDLAYRDEGVGDPPLVWSHGFASSMRSEGNGLIDFRSLAACYRVIRWDARGHGQSEGGGASDDYRWDRLGRDLLELADGLGLARFVAGGLSMGAALALHAAVAAPERVLGLVVVLPPTTYEGRGVESLRYLEDAELVRNQGPDAFIARANATGPPPVLAPVAEDFRWVPDVGAEQLPSVLRGAAASDLPARAAISRLPVPTLILTWADDPGHPLDLAHELRDLIRNSRLEVAREAVDIGTWTAAIADHLRSLSASA